MNHSKVVIDMAERGIESRLLILNLNLNIMYTLIYFLV